MWFLVERAQSVFNATFYPVVLGYNVGLKILASLNVW
jgi:hypothetical protein